MHGDGDQSRGCDLRGGDEFGDYGNGWAGCARDFDGRGNSCEYRLQRDIDSFFDRWIGDWGGDVCGGFGW